MLACIINTVSSIGQSQLYNRKHPLSLICGIYFPQLFPRRVEWRLNKKSMYPLEWAQKASVVGYVI